MAALEVSKRRVGENVRNRKSEFQRGNIFNGPSMGSMQDVLDKKVQAPKQQKSEQTTALLTKALSSHFLFVSLHPKEVAELVEAMNVETIPPGVCVVKQGESGSKFYVVEEGTFEVVLNGSVTSVGGRGSTVGPGQSFGELALIHDGPRHATLRVPKSQPGSGTVVYALTREDFRHIVARQQAAKITEVKETLRKVALLEGLSDTELSTVAASVKVVDFAPGTMVIRKGEPGLEMYIIKEGDVVCEVPGTEPPSSSPSARPRSASVIATKVPLGVGAWFGERALLFDDLRAADVVAGTAGASCYMIKKKTFKDVLGNSDEVLRKMGREVKLQSLASIGISGNLLAAAKAAGRTDGPELLAKLVTLLESQTVEAGPLIKAGEPATTFYIVRTGEISLTASTDLDGETETYPVGKGGCFGEAALITSKQATYSETCEVVSSKGELFALNRSDLELLNFGDLLISAEMRVRMEYSRRKSSSVSMSGDAEKAAAFMSELDALSISQEGVSEEGGVSGGDDDEVSRRATEAFEVSQTVLTAPNGLEDLLVERTIGCGSFGRVKLATHRASGTVCALKILQKDTIIETRQTKNISREKDIVASLTHPNVLRMYGTFQDQDCLYMMLELVNGGELYRLMHGDGSEENVLPFKDMRFYVAQVLNVYEYIHSKNIIYRDLKPENLLISSTGYLKVIDWGFAKEIADNTTYTMCGTPEYLAPEVVNCSGHGRAADLWSLGVNLFEMAVGYSPFVGDDVNDQLEICKNITSGLVEFPADRPVDPLIEDMIRKLLTQDPTGRLGCMADGAKAVQKHPVYGACNDLPSFDWEAMRKFEMAAPWVPDIPGGAKDVSNFDDIYDDDEEEIIPYDGDVTFDF